MTDPEQRAQLAELEAKIARLKAKDAPKPHQEEHYSQAQMAWRMVIELVAGLALRVKGRNTWVGKGLEIKRDKIDTDCERIHNSERRKIKTVK